MSEFEILRGFRLLGLDTEEKRERFQNLSPFGIREQSEPYFIKQDNVSAETKKESQNAQLAQAVRGNQD